MFLCITQCSSLEVASEMFLFIAALILISAIIVLIPTAFCGIDEEYDSCTRLSTLAYPFILLIITPIITLIYNARTPRNYYVGNIVIGIWVLVLISYKLIKHGFCEKQPDESRQIIAREPVDVERPQITVQFERAERQPYRSVPLSEVQRSLPPVKPFIDECAICMEEFKNGDTLQPFGVCVHEFHSSCVQHWFNSGKTTCPLCRRDLSTTLRDT